VTFSTHDLSTFKGWESGHDLGIKRAIGLDPGKTDEERSRARVRMHDALAWRGVLHDGSVVAVFDSARGWKRQAGGRSLALLRHCNL
jgi:4-alpha-glucanotransferase